jgi:hypothetical protein
MSRNDLVLYTRGCIYHIRGTVNGKRVRVSTNTDDLRVAETYLEEVKREYLGGWRADYSEHAVSWKSVAILLCNRHRSSARSRGIPFDLKSAYIYDLMAETSFCCAVSGIALSKTQRGSGFVDPWSASIDRIENRHGYIPGNVRIVSVTANMAMNQFGYDVLLRLANGVVRSSRAVAQEPKCLTPGWHRNMTQSDQPVDVA